MDRYDFRKEAEEFAEQFMDGKIGRKTVVDLLKPYLQSAYARGIEDAAKVVTNKYIGTEPVATAIRALKDKQP